ncbi:MAG: hypothetical protein HY904_01380 [Deltaproteobacteria bacterium]|nr:hypothetical protein [Deltaproteobacteria bacterium]
MTGAWRVGWVEREVPGAPCAVWAEGAAARALAALLLAEPARCAGLRGVGGGGALVLLGEPERLPWVDGARYLAKCEGAESLYVPTPLQPDLAPALVAHAVARHAALPAAVVPAEGGVRVFPLGRAWTVEADALRAFLGAG